MAEITLTNQAQPDDANESYNGQNSQSYPQSRCDIETQPEEALVCGTDRAYTRVRGLEDPV